MNAERVTLNAEQGFTIIELGMVMVIFTTIFVIVTVAMINFFKSYNFSFEEYQAVTNAQAAVTRMVRDIREARTGENGAWPLVSASDTSIMFYADVTNDGKTDLVRYYIDGT